PGWFEKHFDRMRAYDRFASAGVVLGTAANGQVKRCGLLRDLLGPVDFRLAPADLETLKRGIALLAELHFAAGAEAAFPGMFVCDASVFPTSIGINPQLTIMALADYAWRHCIAA